MTKDWRELCACVAMEHDPKRLWSLVEDLLIALNEWESQSQTVTDLAGMTTSSAIN